MLRACTAVMMFSFALISSLSPAQGMDEIRDHLRQNLASEAAAFRYAQELHRVRDTDHFFGLVQWIRLRSWPKLTDVQKDRWLSLELTGLARQCRWSEIDRVYSGETGPWPMAAETMSLIRLKQGYRNFRKDNTNLPQSLGDRVEHARTHWASSPEEFMKFASPIHLKAHVESSCGL